MTIISLQEYAKQKNVSYEAVRKQVVRYKAELEGHVIRDGRQQFLDEEAVAFLDARRQKNPVVLYQQNKDEQIEALEEQVKQLLAKTAAQADKIADLAQWKADNALLIASAEQNRLALEAAEKETKILEGFIQDAKEEISKLTSEASEALREADQLRATLNHSEAARKALEAEFEAQKRQNLELKQEQSRIYGMGILAFLRERKKSRHDPMGGRERC